MSWRYVKYDIEAGEVVAIEDVNENFEAIVSEVEGRLNEHNFAADSFDLDDFTPGVAITLRKNVQASDCNDASTDNDDFDFAPSGQWTAISDLSHSFAAVGGLVWVIASFQLVTLRAGGDHPSYAGVRFGLRVNGIVDPDSISGADDTGVESTITSGADGFGPGIVHVLYPCVAEALVPVPPGACVVELVVATVAENADFFAASHRVHHRELTVIELVR